MLVRFLGVQPYPFQVREPSFSRRTRDPRFGHCSCTRKIMCFWEFQVYRKLGEVLRKLGVVRLKVLDVGIMSCRFDRILWSFSDEIPLVLVLKSSKVLFY